MTENLHVLSADDIHLFNEGKHFRLYNKLGAQIVNEGSSQGVQFSVWAPNAKSVHVFGDFNSWNKSSHSLNAVGVSGIWSGFIKGVEKGSRYKYLIHSHINNASLEKADPFAFYSELPSKTASIVWEHNYDWKDKKWMQTRGQKKVQSAPVSIYEMHLGSWSHKENDQYLTYLDLAKKLPAYLNDLGFTHVELLPVMEHPFYGSWGYQTTGYFAPTSRYGTPQDFMTLVDALHQADIGVILDWVPSHFPNDAFGLDKFDGTSLYEHEDPRQGFHPDWKSSIFNLGRNEVQNFLISSALFWLDKYHIDGIRVDAVASMLYLDYSRKEGEWIPNSFGGRENLEAIHFLKQLNEALYVNYPDIHTTAEESTSWPMVSRPTYLGGLGFGMKWDMGWMHDTLDYFEQDPVYRKFQHDRITFRMIYAFNENFVLPLSHDEIVHGKGSLLTKMPGDDWQKFANLRILYAYMYAMPGKKLLFMGSELAQRDEWHHDEALHWELLNYEAHRGIYKVVSDLNRQYRTEKALHTLDFEPIGFDWIDSSDYQNSVLCFLRKNPENSECVLCLFNLTPVPRYSYVVGVPKLGTWKEIFNSDSSHYGGSGIGNFGEVAAYQEQCHRQPYSISLTLPPLAAIYFKWEKKNDPQ